MTDEYIIRVMAVLFIFAIFFVGQIIWYGVKYLTQEYLEPAVEKHGKLQREYRKYLKNCDKKGKSPLSYRRWKFAYQNK